MFGMLGSLSLLGALLLLFFSGSARGGEFQAGAAIVDVTPETLPVLVNGGMLSRTADKVKSPILARAIAMSDGETRIVIVVVDSCMMPRPLLDEAKAMAAERTGIPSDHLLISATHTHTAPSCMGALGTRADPNYLPFLKEKLAEAVEAAVANLEPAKVGFVKADAGEFTAVRRWIRRPDRLAEDPFGNPTGRANMHSGRVWDDVTGESGPEDPDLALVSFVSEAGRPLAVLGNFSMHYFGDQALSSDYFGLFADGLQAKLGKAAGEAGGAPFVGIMSHGCSGDIWRRDYTKPEGERGEDQSIEDYADGLLEIALQALEEVEYDDSPELAMAEARMTLNYRVPDRQRLEWAQKVVEAMGDREDPKDRTEVYALEQIILHERQSTEIVVQGLRIGEIGIATTPNETYAITGLKIKTASPLKHNLVIELANGGDGYIPPPEQHRFGGYNTWPARSAGLEVMAEPKITATAIGLLERVAGKRRKGHRQSQGPAAEKIRELRPAAWWRLDELTGPLALDHSGNQRDGFYEPDVTYFLEGPRSEYFCEDGERNRAAMFVGGRVQGRVSDLGGEYSVSLWFWNGMPEDSREVAGWLFSRGHDHGLGREGEHLGVGGAGAHAGRLIFFQGDDPGNVIAGKTVVPRWKWQQVVLVKAEDRGEIWLNGKKDLEWSSVEGEESSLDRFFFGGRSDNADNWEGRLDEIAVFDRALTVEEIRQLTLE